MENNKVNQKEEHMKMEKSKWHKYVSNSKIYFGQQIIEIMDRNEFDLLGIFPKNFIKTEEDHLNAIIQKLKYEIEMFDFQIEEVFELIEGIDDLTEIYSGDFNEFKLQYQPEIENRREVLENVVWFFECILRWNS